MVVLPVEKLSYYVLIKGVDKFCQAPATCGTFNSKAESRINSIVGVRRKRKLVDTTFAVMLRQVFQFVLKGMTKWNVANIVQESTQTDEPLNCRPDLAIFVLPMG